jgi:hypothetical protein
MVLLRRLFGVGALSLCLLSSTSKHHALQDTPTFSSLKAVFSGTDSVNRSSSAGLLTTAASNATSSQDPWRTFTHSGVLESVGLATYVEWLAIVSQAGIDCPMDICMQVGSAMSQKSLTTLHRKQFAGVLFRLAFSRTVSTAKLHELVAQNNSREVQSATDVEACVYHGNFIGHT